ncbi:MAG: hypothetical protein ABJN39_09300 [Sulfitobacter sp.]|uniref:hypothetical protein n=1 Tax=Alphaproteobacteria TaxID=28211 RepID=UPI002941F878|nr:hypothetical protein [Sulfitobacter sp. LC.270.F.C4]WOI13570.1 hypothetical protein R1T45_01700 [Sulfitobacter sp. LC.270.F.C4]
MQYQAAKVAPPFVEIDEGAYLLQMLMEAGPVKSAPMGGREALDWVDIHAYLSLTVEDVEGWEANLLRRMSQAYAAGLSEGTSPFSIAPVDRE